MGPKSDAANRKDPPRPIERCGMIVSLVEYKSRRHPMHPLSVIDADLADWDSKLYHLRGSRAFRMGYVEAVEEELEIRREIIALEAKRAAMIGLRPVRVVK